MGATVTINYGDEMETTWSMSKFRAIGVTADLERDHGSGSTRRRSKAGAERPLGGGSIPHIPSTDNDALIRECIKLGREQVIGALFIYLNDAGHRLLESGPLADELLRLSKEPVEFTSNTGSR